MISDIKQDYNAERLADLDRSIHTTKEDVKMMLSKMTVPHLIHTIAFAKRHAEDSFWSKSLSFYEKEYDRRGEPTSLKYNGWKENKNASMSGYLYYTCMGCGDNTGEGSDGGCLIYDAKGVELGTACHQCGDLKHE